jgi:hypothetical protein
VLGVGLGLVAAVALTLLGGVWARRWTPNRLEQWAYGGALALAVWSYLIAGCAALGWMGAVPWTPLVVAGVLGVVGRLRKSPLTPTLSPLTKGGEGARRGAEQPVSDESPLIPTLSPLTKGGEGMEMGGDSPPKPGEPYYLPSPLCSPC